MRLHDEAVHTKPHKASNKLFTIKRAEERHATVLNSQKNSCYCIVVPTAKLKKTRLDGTRNLADFVHRVHPEVRRNPKAAEVVPGALKPSENEVALARRGRCCVGDHCRRSRARGVGRWWRAAFEIAFLS